MKKGIRLCIIILILTISINIVMTTKTIATFGDYIPTEGLTLDNFTSIVEIKNNNELLTLKQENAAELANKARELGFKENSEIIKTAQQEWQLAQKEKQLNTEQLDNWTTKFEEYPYATYIWLYLTDTLNYNNYVAAGILGNIMAEVGGGTLDIQYWLYSYGNHYYYGICQWGKKDYPEVRKTDLIYQCNFLSNNIEYEFNTFGYCYKTDFKYNDFILLTDSAVAAKAFAAGYERCNSKYYSIRQTYALIAYDYFTRGEN